MGAFGCNPVASPGERSAVVPRNLERQGVGSSVDHAATRRPLYELTDVELLKRLGGCQSALPGTSGEERNLLWDEILELEGELQRRYPPSTDPLTR